MFQQEYYDKAYDVSYNEMGFPDRKISDGRALTGCWVLNVGGGAGQDLWYLLPDNRVVNLDYAIGGLQAGRQRGVAGVQVNLNAQMAGLPFPDGTFDVVVCKDILEHLLDPLGVLLEVRRILKPDGYVVVSVPNHFYLPFRLRILFGKNLIWKTIGADHTAVFEEWNYMHIRFFTYRGFCKFLDRAGLWPKKFFWDFGTLAHYHNPEMYLEPQVRKAAEGRPLSRRGKMGLYVLRPVYWLLNLVFPRQLRSWIVGLAPGLLCAGFYVHCVPWPISAQGAS